MSDMTLPQLSTPSPVPDAPVRDVYVLPGQISTASTPTRFFTVLGSCVSICLYDRGAGVGGINHFLLPGTPPPEESDRARWSHTAIDQLFDDVRQAGARERHLEAKIFGGARISALHVPDALRIGERNIEEAVAALRKRRVPLVNQGTGGSFGRKIVFESHTGVVWVKDLVRGAAAVHNTPSTTEGKLP